MAELIALGIAVFIFCKLFPTTSVTPERSFDQDVEDFIVMDVVCDGELDGDFE